MTQPDLGTALKALLGYYWEDEEADFNDSGCPDNHIFHHLATVSDHIEGVLAKHFPQKNELLEAAKAAFAEVLGDRVTLELEEGAEGVTGVVVSGVMGDLVIRKEAVYVLYERTPELELQKCLCRDAIISEAIAAYAKRLANVALTRPLLEGDFSRVSDKYSQHRESTF